ncbi:LCP family protein [Aureibacillus halotolerans]|uniref:Regulatory protein MsrR n=1 Tax=Aureibacillus halotolerans TaxID=1508390 RepID=A0A4R6U728_9BACI|nr:LCP family protein [Aureibacillus halotolerans]TDQ42121.1 LytR family transcriptional attenuator [Aureibacillus halotolerans]
MAETRIIRKKKKKRKKVYLGVFIFLTLFCICIAYVSNQYIQAKNKSQAQNPDWSEEIEDKSDDFKGVESPDEKINVLLLGIDTAEAESSRTDTIMVAQYDPENGTAKLASIMRDTYVNIPGHGYNKINAAYVFGGIELLRQTIQQNFGIDVGYYSIVNFNGFTDVVDSLAKNGIEIDVEKRMHYVDNAGGLYIDLQPGMQTLNGEQLLHYARFRHDSEGDFGRVRRQQQVIQAVKDELLSVNGLLKLPELIGTIEGYTKTNMNQGDIFGYVKEFLQNPVEDIQTLQIPVENSYWNERHPGIGAVLEMDEQQNRQTVQHFFSSDYVEQEEQQTTTDISSEQAAQ